MQGFGRSRMFPDAITDINWIFGDFTQEVSVARAVEGIDVVFYMMSGSLPEGSNHDPAGDLYANVVPSLSLLEICKTAKVKKIVFASSGGAIYGAPDTGPIPETARTDPIASYGIGKLAIEKYLALYHHLYGLDYTIVRIANPFGPYQAVHRRRGGIATLIQKALRGEALEFWARAKRFGTLYMWKTWWRPWSARRCIGGHLAYLTLVRASAEA